MRARAWGNELYASLAFTRKRHMTHKLCDGRTFSIRLLSGCRARRMVVKDPPFAVLFLQHEREACRHLDELLTFVVTERVAARGIRHAVDESADLTLSDAHSSLTMLR